MTMLMTSGVAGATGAQPEGTSQQMQQQQQSAMPLQQPHQMNVSESDDSQRARIQQQPSHAQGELMYSKSVEQPPNNGQQRRPPGPCFLKLLVSNVVAGSIIGQKGSSIGRLSATTGATVRLSHANCYFPGTTDRVLVMWGEFNEIRDAFAVILDKIRTGPSPDAFGTSNRYGQPVVPSSNGRVTVKLIVPNSAVSQLIGKQGQSIRELQERTGARVQVSSRDEHQFKERVVTIAGSFESVSMAAYDIMERVQTDPHLKDHTSMNYVATQVRPPPMAMGPDYSQIAALNRLQQAQHSAQGPQTLVSGAPLAFQLGQQQQPLYAQQREHLFPSLISQYPMAMVNQSFMATPQGYGRALQGSGVQPEPFNLAQAGCVYVDLPDNVIGLLIGKQGATLATIQQQTGTKITVAPKGDYVPGTLNRRVTIRGTTTGIQYACGIIEHRLTEAERTAAAVSAATQ